MRSLLALTGMLIVGASTFFWIRTETELAKKYPEWKKKKSTGPSDLSIVISALFGALVWGLSDWKSDLGPWIFLGTYTFVTVPLYRAVVRSNSPQSMLFTTKLSAMRMAPNTQI